LCGTLQVALMLPLLLHLNSRTALSAAAVAAAADDDAAQRKHARHRIAQADSVSN
jgi:hypothetical protein